MKEIVNLLIQKEKTIATMESCTGGKIVNEITNVVGASKVLQYSAVTYATEFKIKLGVSEETIRNHTVYSKETAQAMAKAISKYATSDFGIGITGKLEIGKYVYISIYKKETQEFQTESLQIQKTTRLKAKTIILNQVKDMLIHLI